MGRENGIILCKLKKDQAVKMTCSARKGVPKYHGKFNPTATTVYRYQPVIKLDREVIDGLALEEKVDFVQSCPRKVFSLDIEDHVQIDKLDECIFCDECCVKARELGKRDMVKVSFKPDTFHFIVEGVTPDGPRTAVDIERGASEFLTTSFRCFCTMPTVTRSRNTFLGNQRPDPCMLWRPLDLNSKGHLRNWCHLPVVFGRSWEKSLQFCFRRSSTSCDVLYACQHHVVSVGC